MFDDDFLLWLPKPVLEISRDEFVIPVFEGEKPVFGEEVVAAEKLKLLLISLK